MNVTDLLTAEIIGEGTDMIGAFVHVGLYSNDHLLDSIEAESLNDAINLFASRLTFSEAYGYQLALIRIGEGFAIVTFKDGKLVGSPSVYPTLHAAEHKFNYIVSGAKAPAKERGYRATVWIVTKTGFESGVDFMVAMTQSSFYQKDNADLWRYFNAVEINIPFKSLPQAVADWTRIMGNPAQVFIRYSKATSGESINTYYPKRF